MKKRFLAKLLMVFSTTTLFTYSVIYACSDNGDWGWFFDSNFTPETFVDKSYSPLFLSQEVFYGIGFDGEHNTRFNDEIVSDWVSYLKGNLDRESVKFFLIDSSAADVNQLFAFYSTKKGNATSAKWAKKMNLKEPKNKNFIEFLYYAQKIEKTSVNSNDWDYEEVQPKSTIDAKIISNIENKYKTITDQFLKNRYWFQTMKANFYSTNKGNTKLFFQKTENSVPRNSLYYRALAYVAGVEFKQKNFAKSNYLYSQVFDKLPAMRVVAAYCFHPQEEKDWNQSLAMAKTNDEKAALWGIQGYYGDEERAIKNIFDLNPKSEHLEYLLTRLVNRQEIKIDKSFKDETVQQHKKSIKSSIAISSINLVSKIAQSNNTSKPYLWNIAAGYLATLGGDFEKADRYFDISETKMPKNQLAISQVRLLRLINNLSKMDAISPQNEKTISKDLAWLYLDLPKLQIENFRYQNASNWSKKYLSSLYKSQNNKVMEELFSRSLNYYSNYYYGDNSGKNEAKEFYENETNIMAMKTFFGKKNKSEMENIAESVYGLKLIDVNEYQAIKAAFKNKIPEAIAFMQQADSLKDIKLLGNPFNGNIKDCHDCEHQAFQKKKYSQLEFLQTIKEMQEKIAKKEDIYTNSLLLGNAFYNISHHGNARLFYESSIIGYGGSSPYYFSDTNRKMITDNAISKMYYQKAFENASNKEQKAKTQYLLAKCERNEFYNGPDDGSKPLWDQNSWYGENAIHFLAWNGFKNLKNNYSDTQYYKDVINECGYFRTYISHN